MAAADELCSRCIAYGYHQSFIWSVRLRELVEGAEAAAGRAAGKAAEGQEVAQTPRNWRLGSEGRRRRPGRCSHTPACSGQCTVRWLPTTTAGWDWEAAGGPHRSGCGPRDEVSNCHHPGKGDGGPVEASQAAAPPGDARQAACCGRVHRRGECAVGGVEGARREVLAGVVCCGARHHPLHRHAAQGMLDAQVGYHLHRCQRCHWPGDGVEV
mmetsp:Transcript_14338/g.43311  ORF Transcript_14338/g.43311 Transcript_14338/m.43311 type:complete len:212 (-) Transcript_14338:584-1219(-)